MYAEPLSKIESGGPDNARPSMMLAHRIATNCVAADPTQNPPPLSSRQFTFFAMVLTLGRAEPITMAEHIFGLLAMVVMGCIYAYAIASVCGILATMDPASTEFRNTKDLIKTWAAEVHMPDDLKNSMLLYIDESQAVIRQRFYGTMLELLSPALRGAASQHIAGELLRNVTFLLCDDDAERCAFTSAVSQKLVLRVFAQGEHIASADDPADALYVIVKGLVAQARFLLLLLLLLLLLFFFGQLALKNASVIQAETGFVLCNGRFFGEEVRH